MKFEATKIPGVIIVEPRVFGDERGFFFEVYHEAKFRENGIDVRFVQDNHSQSVRGTLRGLHGQRHEPQGKLVRAIEGAIFDVAVDLRRASPTFEQWIGVELSAENRRQLWVPPGLAHGFLVTSERAQVEYKCTAPYRPDDEFGIRWDDSELGIDWPISESPILSSKDAEFPGFDEVMATLPDYPLA